jgi:FMN phosphatase YigB (HAD superfamily)
MIKAITFDLWNTLLEDKDFTEHRMNLLSGILRDEDLQIPRNDLLTTYNSASDYYRREWEINPRHLPARAGMKAVWLRNNRNLRRIDCTPDYVINR